MLIPSCQKHILTGVKVERRPLSVDVIIKTLCGQQGKVQNLDFQFVQEADIGCAACHGQYLQLKEQA